MQMKTINYCMICQVLLSPPKGQEFYPPFPISVQRFKHQIILLINFFLVQGNWGVPLTRTAEQKKGMHFLPQRGEAYWQMGKTMEQATMFLTLEPT